LKKRSKVLEAGKRERYRVSDCIQCFTLSARSEAGHTEVYATECWLAKEDGGTSLYCESTSVWQ
jgi:hypothetical protein